jgi:aspartate racemase
MVAAMRGGLERLQQAGAAFIAVPCNIAHTWLSELSQAGTVPIIDMIDETVRQVPTGARVALLATPATLESGLYQRRLMEMDAALVDGPDWQQRVTSVIAAVKQGHLPAARDELAGLLQDMQRQEGVDLALCACTDLNPAMPRQPPLRVIDSARALADASIGRWLALAPAVPTHSMG